MIGQPETITLPQRFITPHPGGKDDSIASEFYTKILQSFSREQNKSTERKFAFIIVAGLENRSTCYPLNAQERVLDSLRKTRAITSFATSPRGDEIALENGCSR